MVGVAALLMGGGEPAQVAATTVPSPETSAPADTAPSPTEPPSTAVARNEGETDVADLAAGDCILSPTGNVDAGPADFTGAVTVIQCQTPLDLQVVADVTMLNAAAVYPGIEDPQEAARRWCGEQMEAYVRRLGIIARFAAVMVALDAPGGFQVKCIVIPVGARFFTGDVAPG